MTAFDIHAALLVFVALLGPIALGAAKHRTPTFRQGTIALGLAVLAIFIGSSIHHACREGDPVKQWLLPAPGLVLVLCFMQSNAWRRIIGGVVAIAMIGLSCHFTDLVHEPYWTGNPRHDSSRLDLRTAQQAVTGVAVDLEAPADFPAGWLRDLPLWTRMTEFLGNKSPQPKRHIRTAWHSRFTGLYPYEAESVDWWYSGGPFNEEVTIELRPRDEGEMHE